MLELSAISKRYGATTALEEVSLSLLEGEICGLVGHNGAGKSTLIKIIAGAEQADNGTISVDGQLRQFLMPHDAYEAGIRVIHQDAPLVPEFDSIENCFLGRSYPKKFGTIDRKEMAKTIAGVAEEIAPDLDLKIPVSFLPPAEKQFVRLLKAVADAGSMLILDEPTSALAAEDADSFFAVLQRLRERGTSILLVSHRLDEIASVCDRATVLSDGRKIAEFSGITLSVPNLISAMGGGASLEPVSTSTPAFKDAPSVLEIADLTTSELVVPVDFALKAGEIVTLYGLAGSGRSSLLQAIWGARKSTGTMRLKAKRYAPKNPHDAVHSGVSYVPADRHRTGLFPDLSLIFNKTIPLLERFRRKTRLPLPDQEAERSAFLEAATIVSMTYGAPEHLAKTLSGGNQQKLLFSRWTDRHSALVLLDEPTEGIDINARATIKDLIRQMAKEGSGVLISTSDRDEALELGDRIAVFRDGALVQVFSRKEASPEALATWAQAKTDLINPPQPEAMRIDSV